jgi:acetyl esterase/lipase/acyl-coenzyme A synthetase/AMP-(fatty) acid ligase
MLAAALGAMKAGKFYVAVNPLHPAAHVQCVLDELAAPLLLCDRRGAVAARRGVPALSVEEMVAARPSVGRPGLRFDGARFAYVLYTSGSTGRPRGVAQSRRDMLHNVWRHRPLAVGRDDCVTLISADGFVASVSNVYVALLGGAALAPYSFRDAGAEGMIDWLRAGGVTVLYAFPSFLRQLAAIETVRVHGGLRLAYLGGETVLPADLEAARRLFPKATLGVGLNSSETGLTCLHLILPGLPAPDPVPVGRPVLDVDVAILDGDGRPTIPGEPGEIEIRSEYVRPRYWARKASPEDGSPDSGFRTGDRGRIGADGIVYHLGRLDRMVKVRGFRVETAEVEAAIADIPAVEEVAVFGAGEGPATDLAACVVVGSEADLDPPAVRRAVALQLPPAMVPTRVAIVPELPRTPNGKLDRRRLGELLNGSGPAAGEPTGDAVADDALADDGDARLASADSAVARRIAAIWRSEIDIDHVDPDDDFFALGGTSIAAVSVAARLRGEFGVQVPLAVLFETPTVAALAAAVIELRREHPAHDLRTEPLLRELMELQAPLRAMGLVDRRQQYERAEKALGADIAPGETVDAGGCAAEWVLAQRDPAQPVVIYLHGGGYSLGSPRSHRHLAAAIGGAAGAAVLSLDYRRAPESAFPAAVEDATAATRWLLGRTHGPVVLAGDSAGGGLVLATMLALRDADAPLPAAGVCLSPWVDLTCTADAYSRLALRDPLLSAAELRRMARAYLREADPRDPFASPAFADLAGLPPLLIQVGTDEILLDDARTLAAAARAAGVEVTLQEWPEMIHTWQWYFPILEDGRRAIADAAAFIQRHIAVDPARTARPQGEQERAVPASLIQEAHLQIVPETSGRGYLSWVYQLNGPLDRQALARALDDVVRRHEILRARFERRDGRLYVAVTPFTPGMLDLVDLTSYTKRDGLKAAVEDAEAVYDALSPAEDSRLRATLYAIGPKTSVLAMFVAEALVDSDSGSLLAADISRTYAHHTGTPLPVDLPQVGDASHLDHIASHPPASAAVARARRHWERQARNAPTVTGWPMTTDDIDLGGSASAFQLTPAEWARVTAHAQTLATTPYVFVLTCLQVALAHVAEITHFLAHSVVSTRGDIAHGMIGNFHSLVRVDLRLDPHAAFKGTIARTAVAVADAIQHCDLPASLTASEAGITLSSGDSLPGIRFYMFSNHEGPMFVGIRRRRFRLHGVPRAPLTVSCIYGPQGKQDFVFSSTTAPQALLEYLAMTVKVVLLSLDKGIGNPNSIDPVGFNARDFRA